MILVVRDLHLFNFVVKMHGLHFFVIYKGFRHRLSRLSHTDGRLGYVLSETLQKLLQLGDNLCVHRLHEGLEALLSQELLLCLKLLVDKLLQRHCVDWVLQGQLQDREEPQRVREAEHVPPPCNCKAWSSPWQQHNCFCLPAYKRASKSPTAEKSAREFIQSV